MGCKYLAFLPSFKHALGETVLPKAGRGSSSPRSPLEEAEGGLQALGFDGEAKKNCVVPSVCAFPPFLGSAQPPPDWHSVPSPADFGRGFLGSMEELM